MSESQQPSLVHILLGVIVLCVIVQMLGLYDFTTLMGDKTAAPSTIVPGPTVPGPTVPGSSVPGPTVPGSSGSPPENTLSSPTLFTPNVKYIELKKTNASLSISDDTSFLFRELKVYDNNSRLLTKADFLTATTSAPGYGTHYAEWPWDNALDSNEQTFTHAPAGALITTIKYELNNLTFVKKVEVVNFVGGQSARLQGVKLNLYDANMSLINSCTLTSNPKTECTW